jgi:hypothetical protein
MRWTATPRYSESLVSAPLDTDAEDLLRTFVAAAAAVPREQQEFFYDNEIVGGAGLGRNIRVLRPDMTVLDDAGFIDRYHFNTRGTYDFVVTAAGRQHVDEMEKRGDPAARLEDEMVAYLKSDTFSSVHPEAHRLWSEAETLLRADNSQQELTTVGHKVREAIQTFTTDLVDLHRPEGVDPNPGHTVSRVEAVINQHEHALGEKVTATLSALVHFWGTVSDLAQRQEHGHQKGNEPLTHEDGRRLVFLSAAAMHEIHWALAEATPLAGTVYVSVPHHGRQAV